jgi:hypothetical protein
MLRKNLRLAVKGDQRAFITLADHYLDLASEYLYLSGAIDSAAMIERACDLYFRVWQCLSYAHRVSDFERLIAVALQLEENKAQELVACPLSGKLRELKPLHKLLLVTHEMENWPRHWTGLATRLSRRELEQKILEMRCQLLGFNLAILDQRVSRCLMALSRDFNEGLTLKERADLCSQVEQLPEIKEFPAEWISLRCEIIELRQQIRLNSDQRTVFANTLLDRLADGEMIRPLLRDRVRNIVHFGNHPDMNTG